MPEKLTAEATLEREYLPVRGKILEIAAALDRITRCEGSNMHDPRLKQFHSALEILLGAEPDRAERIQLLFSRPYEENWPVTLQMPSL